VKDDDGLNLSFVEPKDIFPNREAADSLGIDYCIVCGFAKKVEQACDHSLVVPYQSSKDSTSSSIQAFSQSGGARESISLIGSNAQQDFQGDSKLPFCSNCGHAFENSSAKFCPSCGSSRS
jgi:NADH pyrophosphatase NudC (nudix superfamily)